MESNILNYWLSCIREQDIQKTSIDSNLSPEQVIKLDDDAALLSNQRDSVKVTLARPVLDILKKEKTRQFYRNNKDSRPVFFFPLITINNQSYPLFYVDLVDIELDLIKGATSASFEINPWSVDTKVGVVTDTFAKLGYDEEMIDLSDSVINFIEKITGRFTLNFQLALAELLEFLVSESKGSSNRYMRVTETQNVGLVKYSDFSEATLIFKKDLLFIKDNPSLINLPIINDYLTKVSEKVDFINKPFYGAFFKFPMSKGQALSVSEVVNSPRSIISVQGGAGTGKTTTILSCISALLTNRAIAIAKGKDNDECGFYLVTSFTNKAVDNVANIIKEQYGEKFANLICLQLGNKDKRIHAVDDINKLISQLELETFDRVKYEKLKAFILHRHSSLHDKYYVTSQKDASYTPEEQLLLSKIGYKGNYSTSSLVAFLSSVIKSDEGTAASTLSVLEASLASDVELLESIKIKLVVMSEERAIYDSVAAKCNVSSRLVKDVSQMDNVKSSGELNQGWFMSLLSALGLSTIGVKSKNEQLKVRIYQLLENARAKPYSHYLKSHKEASLTLNKVSVRLRQKKALVEVIKKLSLNSTSHSSIDVMRLNSVNENRDLFEASLYFLYQDILKKKDLTITALTAWSKVLLGQRTDNKEYLNNLTSFVNIISRPFPVLTCTLSSLGSIFDHPESTFIKHKPFEVTMCDEAGIVPIFCMPSILMRSKKALVIGDQKQLSVIISIEGNRLVDLKRRSRLIDDNNVYNPMLSSAFQRSAFASCSGYADIGESVILDEHRRCLSKIAKCFIDIGGYSNITNHTPMLSNDQLKMYESISYNQITLVDVKGTGKRRNTNEAEIDTIEILLNDMESKGINLREQVGIITPFQNQSILLQNRFRKRLGHDFNNKKIGTVHAFQGAEYDIVLLSMVAYNDSFYINFITKAPNLLNVAISRAKNRLIVVGDKDYLSQQSGNIEKLLKHADQ